MRGKYRTRSITHWLAILAAGFVLGGSAAWGGTPLRLFVSSRGNDAWSGRLDTPNASRSDGPLDAIEEMRK